MKCVKLSSSQRATGSTGIGNFRLDLTSSPLDGKYKLAELFIANSYYNVNATNNVLYWTESGGSTPVQSTTVPVGCYSARTLATAVATAMNAVTTTLSTFTGTYSSITHKMSFTSSPSTPLVFTFDTHTTNSIGALIGFVGSEDPASGGAAVANPLPLLSFNIQIGGSTEIHDSKGSGFTFVIPINCNPGAYILYNPSPGYIQTAMIPRASVLNIRVVDDTNTTIALLNDWYMVLEKCD